MSGGFGIQVHERIAELGLCFLIAILFSPSLHAQLLRGAISGTASDQQGAAVPGVRVTITNQETRVAEITATTDAGVYRLPVLPGIYSVEFTKDGFQTLKSMDVEVQSGRDTTIDAPLRVGTPATTIDVTATGTELDKVSATVRVNLPGRILDEIPMSTSSLVPAGSRNFARFPLLAPGVVRVLYQNEISANGHRGRENNFLLDGTDNNDQSVTLPALFIPPEAIQEVDIQAATFSAEYGRNIGAQVNVITKSGTNSLRGQLWEFYRGNALEPLSLTDCKAYTQRTGLTDCEPLSPQECIEFMQRTGLTDCEPRKPRLVDNQFGGALGGPIVRNKTFFFGMVQGNRLRTGPRGLSPVAIPTPTGYAALLTAPLRSTPTPQTSASRQAVLDALSFLPEVHSTISSYSNTMPLSTSVNGTFVELGQFSPVIPTHQNIWYGVIRVDHQLSDNDRLTFRSHIDRRISPLSSGNLAFGERWAADNKYFGQNHFIGYTKNIGSSFINEARLSYSRLFPTAEERDPVTPTTNIINLFQIGGSASFPQERLEQTWQFQNVSTYIVSNHSLKFGVDLARTKLKSNVAANSKGTWTFPNLESFLNSQPSRLDFLASLPTLYDFAQWRQAYFFQDDVKLRRNLTVNLGLRYETSSVPSNPQATPPWSGFFGATTQEVLDALVPGPVERDKNNWGPRVGFAYSPEFDSGLLGMMFGDGMSSIRGGFGIGYDVLFYTLLANPALNYPRSSPQTLTSSAPVDQYPVLPQPVSSPTLSASSSFVNLPSDSQNPTSHYWSFSIQRQIQTNYSLELGYNGNRSYHLIRQSQTNPGVLSAAKAAQVIAGCTSATYPACQDPSGFPTSPSRLNSSWGSRTTLEPTGNASYNALYVQLNGRSHLGLRFGANYTWSANLSDSEEAFNDSPTKGVGDGGLSGSSPQIPQDYLNRRNEWSRSVFDRPHRLTFNYTYEIPWFRNTGELLEHVFKGWQLSGFTEVQSGQPFTIIVGVDTLGNGTTASGRPDYNPAGILTADPNTGNLRTFVTPLDGTGIVTAPHVINPTTGTISFLKNSMPLGGNLGRNTFRGPGYANSNMSLMKRFSLPGERELQIRGDFINVFNHDNFPNPDNTMSSGTFGTQIWRPLTDARQVLLGAKLSF